MKFNDEGLTAMLEMARRNLREADEQFRSTHGGLPVEVIIEDIPMFGPPVQFSPAMLEEYAGAVSANAPFEFVLTG